ncbi:hypothetical protein E2C01_005024 [Portunus trituberculatus]|uniref:Uncharacterized protein n=1 Tax=Portunus trituberculatus TaxID=210409 RepID=A0A5B7CVI0_PORTR|nr:hypothetical protein [Portunus trituberculatus]
MRRCGARRGESAETGTLPPSPSPVKASLSSLSQYRSPSYSSLSMSLYSKRFFHLRHISSGFCTPLCSITVLISTFQRRSSS